MDGTFTWGSALLAVLNLLIGGLLVAIVRIQPALKKIRTEREQSQLEARGEDMEAMRTRIEKLEDRLEKKDAEHEAEVKIIRHRLNNVTQAFEALLLLLETAPDKAAEHVQRIKALRADQIKAEAAEKGAVAAAKIQGMPT